MMLSNRFRKVNVRHLNVLVLSIPVNLLPKASQLWKPRNEILLVETKLLLQNEDALGNKDVDATKHS